MQRRVVIPRLSVLAAVAAVSIAITACGSSSPTSTGLTAADLVGTYNLVSLTLGNSQPLTPPTATGVLTLALTTYKVTLNLPQPTGTQVDSGTWTVSGTNWTQTSSVNPIQETGTVKLSNDTLTVNVNVAGAPILNVWVKQH